MNRRYLTLLAGTLMLAEVAWADDVALRMAAPCQADLTTWHFRTGVPFAKGQLTDAAEVRLFRGDQEISIQTEILATWGPKGSDLATSIKWLGLDFVDDVVDKAAQEYRLVFNEGPRRPPPALTVSDEPQRIVVKNGRLDITFRKTGFNLFDSVTLDGRRLIPPGGSRGAYITDAKGRTFRAESGGTETVEVEMQGPLACIIRAVGWFTDPSAPEASTEGEPRQRPKGGFCRYVTRVYLAAGQPRVRVQHTFILTEDSRTTQYRDIGLIIPVGDFADARYGGVPGEHVGRTYLAQTAWDAFEVHRLAGDTSRKVYSGARADGWVQAGSIGICIREFWQNYPSEIEADTDGGRVVVHFWPGHGRNNPDRKYTVDDGWRLWFVHENEDLDFRIPPAYWDKEIFGDVPQMGIGKDQQGIEWGKQANAMGIAKTTNMLVCFGEDEAVSDVNEVFQDDPHALPDPTFLCRTGVLGRVVSTDESTWPRVDRHMAGGLHFMLDWLEGNFNYGMWNYGDTHHAIAGPQEPKPGVQPAYPFGVDYFRVWAGFHHGYARVPWWLYMRGGDPRFLNFARAQTLHLMDVDLCHWHNGELSDASLGVPARKHRGGLCDYKGVVHWNAGARNAYNSMIDAFLYDFYLTGNRRAWDAVMEHGYYTLEHGAPVEGRSGAGQADTLVNLWTATWDPKARQRADALAECLMAKPPDEQHALNWSPWLTRYWEATGSERAKRFILDWVEKNGRSQDPANIIAYAYYTTKQEKYAVEAMRMLFQCGNHLYRQPGTPYDSYMERFDEWAFPTQWNCLAYEAASAVTPVLDMFQGDHVGKMRYRGAQLSNKYNYLWPMVIPGQGRAPRLHIKLRAEEMPFERTFNYSCHTRPEVTIHGPGGAPVVEAEGDTETRRGTLSFAIPEGSQPGWYTMTIDSRPPMLMDCLPRLHPSLLIEIGRSAPFPMFTGEFFVWVPEDTETFALTLGTQTEKPGAALTVYGPDCREVATASLMPGEVKVMKIDVAPERRGKPWMITGTGFVVITQVNGIPPFMSKYLAALKKGTDWPSVNRVN